MTPIPDFMETGHIHVSALLFERYGKIVMIQQADSELQLGADPSQLTLCPALY